MKDRKCVFLSGSTKTSLSESKIGYLKIDSNDYVLKFSKKNKYVSRLNKIWGSKSTIITFKLLKHRIPFHHHAIYNTPSMKVIR